LGYGLKENFTLQCTPCFFGKLQRSPHHLPLSPLPLCLSAALLHRPPPLAGELPRCQLPLAALTPPPGPPTHPPAARPTPAGFSPPRHVMPPSPEAARSRRRSPAAAPACRASFYSCSMSRSLPRLHIHSHAPAFSPLGFFSAQHRRQTTAAGSAHHRQPSPPPHTHNPVLHQHHYTPLKLPDQFFSIHSRSRHQNTAPAILSTAAARPHRRPDTPPPLGPHRAHHQHHIYVWKLPSYCFTAFLHSGCWNAAASSGPRRAGSVLRRTAVSAPFFFDSGHPQARRELLNLFPHFPLAACDPPRQNLTAAAAVPRFKPARDPIADILFFLGSSLQNFSTPLNSNQQL
jgi:hypothetical protein